MPERALQAPEHSFFLLVPHGSGKSTWLHTTFPDAHFADLLSEATYQSLLADPGQFAGELRAVDPGRWVVVIGYLDILDDTLLSFRAPGLEGLVAQLLRSYRDHTGPCDEISHWSGGGRGTEVEFVLAWSASRIAVEVKAGRQFNERWCRGLRAIAPLDGSKGPTQTGPERVSAPGWAVADLCS